VPHSSTGDNPGRKRGKTEYTPEQQQARG
jgi:hypothetical protein